MLKSILNYFKNRNNPNLEKQDFEIEIAFSITDLVIFVIIVFLVFKFV
jgi:hypothetical protein